MEVGILLRLVGLINFILFSFFFYLIRISSEGPTEMILSKKKSTFILACTKTFADFQTWYDGRDDWTSQLPILIPVGLTLTSAQKLHLFSPRLINQFGWHLVCCHVLVCYIINIQESELYIDDILLYIFNILLHQDTWERICFKFGIMIDITKLMSPVWIALILIQGHKVKGKLEHTSSFCCKVAWSNPDLYNGWLCWGDDFKKPCKCGEYGSSEHLLFLFLVLYLLSCFVRFEACRDSLVFQYH